MTPAGSWEEAVSILDSLRGQDGVPIDSAFAYAAELAIGMMRLKSPPPDLFAVNKEDVGFAWIMTNGLKKIVTRDWLGKLAIFAEREEGGFVSVDDERLLTILELALRLAQEVES